MNLELWKQREKKKEDEHNVWLLIDIYIYFFEGYMAKKEQETGMESQLNKFHSS